MTAVLSVAVVYLAAAWTTTGRTYGTRLLACVLLPVCLLWCGVSPSRRSLQDVVFRTVVLYDSTRRAAA